MTVATFDQAAATRGTSRLLVWVDFYGKSVGGSDTTYVWSGHTIPSPSTYESGPAEGRVISFGSYERGLSSARGELRVGSMTIVLSDLDRTLRGFLGRETQLGMINIEAAVRAIPDNQWRLGYEPVTIFRGVVRRYEPAPDFTFMIELSDWLGVRSSQPFPLQPLTTNDFPTLPESAAGAFAPLVLGVIASANGTSGRVPVTYVGEFTALDTSTWSGFLVAYGAVSVTHVYQNSAEVDSGNLGITWAVPGMTGFAALFGSDPYYTDTNSRRYTLIYVLGPDGAAHVAGTAPITVATTGYDTVGTLAGTAITSIYDHLPWLLKNFILPDVAHPDVGGNWLSVPAWEDGTLRLDAASFTATAADAASEISGPSRGWIISSPDAIADVLGHALVLGDCAFGFNRLGQAMVTLLPPIPDGATITESVSYVHDVLDGFHVVDDPQTFANRFGALYGFDPVEGVYSNRLQIEDPESKAWYRVWANGPELDLYGVDDVTVAEEIATRALLRSRKPSRLVVVPRALPGLSDDLGDRQLLTHPEGPTATGYVGRRIAIAQVGTNLDDDAVDHLAYDLDWVRAVGETVTFTVLDQGVWRAVTSGGGRPSSSVVIGGGGGGGGGSTFAQQYFLGGSLGGFVQSPTPDWLAASPVRISVNTVTRGSTTGNVTARLMAANAGVSVTARLWNVTDGVSVGESDDITATSLTDAPFVVNLTAGTKTYELQVLASAAGEDVAGTGWLE